MVITRSMTKLKNKYFEDCKKASHHLADLCKFWCPGKYREVLDEFHRHNVWSIAQLYYLSEDDWELLKDYDLYSFARLQNMYWKANPDHGPIYPEYSIQGLKEMYED